MTFTPFKSLSFTEYKNTILKRPLKQKTNQNPAQTHTLYVDRGTITYLGRRDPIIGSMG